MNIYMLAICGNCDFRYGGRCTNIKGRVKRPKRETKGCSEFKCWGKPGKFIAQEEEMQQEQRD